jgi:ubiquitin C-terminal hydrolase
MPRKSPKNQAFGGYARQHDASEFLEYFLSVLHDETNRNRNKPDYQAQIIALRPKDLPEDKKDDWDDDVNLSSVNTQVLMLQEWRRLVNGDDSVISRMFHGQEAWLTRCTVPTCGFTVKRFRSLPMLHLIFPVDVITGTSKRTSISLMEMMRTTVNTSKESAGFNEGYKCKKCGTKDVCWQTRTITYFPDYFIVTIMRFAADYNDDYVAGRVPDMAKITLPVKFTETMDLSQLFIPLGPPPPGGIELERGQVGPFIYDCYGIAIHSGNTLQSGHYVAMTRSLDKPGLDASTWHKFDDRTVRPTNFSESQLPNTHVTQIFMKRRQQA